MKDSGVEVWTTLKQGGLTWNRYKISNLGRVWDNRRGTFVSQFTTGVPKYFYVNLVHKKIGRRQKRVHNCMCWSFLGDPPTKKHTADHNDRNRFNNSLNNLSWEDKRTQAYNRNTNVRFPDGTPVRKFLEDEGYPWEGLGGYIYRCIQKDNKMTLKDAMFKWAENLTPTYRIKEYLRVDSIEYQNIWYPNRESLCKHKSNCGLDALRERLSRGMSLEEALTFKHDPAEIYRFWYKDRYLTTVEHCEVLNRSYGRVSTKMQKFQLSFEDAMKLPIERYIKYSINGEVIRTKTIYERFGINPRTANSYLNKSGTVRTLRDTLEHFGIDTSDLEIHLCDGDVIMWDKPI